MLQRELTYRLSFERLDKLSRSASFKAFRTLWWLAGLWLLLFLVALVTIVVNIDALHQSIQPFGIPAGPGLLFFAATIIFFAGSRWQRKLWIAQNERRGSFNETIRLTQDEHGLRFCTDEAEHYLKWKGISQLLLERDGIAVSHGNVFFLVPDTAFGDAAERLAFIRDIYARMGKEAQAVSLRHIGPLLEGGPTVAAS